MLYKEFYHWCVRELLLRHYCEHDWRETNVTYSGFKELWEIGGTGFRHHFHCYYCNKKKTLKPNEVPSKNTIYI